MKPKVCCNSKCDQVFYSAKHEFFIKEVCDKCVEYKQRPIGLEDFVHGFEFEMWDDFEKKWYKHTYSIFPPQNEERFYYSLQTLSKFRRI